MSPTPFIKDGKGFVESLNIRNIDINNLSNAQKGDIGERTAQVVVKSQGLSCYFCDGKTNANGLDNIFRDNQGNFIIDESKFVSGNAGLSRLSTSTGHRQLTNE